MPDIENAILEAKDKLPHVTPVEPQQMPESSAQALKSRLQWGEPAFTILDVRDRTAFNQGRIMGAMPMPIDQLPDRALESLDKRREIYIYGQDDEQSTQAANQLRNAGFESVSVLKGGLASWREIGGPTEGYSEQLDAPPQSAYNIKDRLQDHANVTSKNL
ncbi:MAG TPA: rhodanese-like domain-containing protein [Cyanobacteria bacterium UBA11162]|nr:rhodanese-like domain-containing protein [Cyanobacteria bacterium UBA11162]